MNKPIRTISIFCLLLFLALMINATYLQYWQGRRLDKDPRNRRVIEAAFSRERGAILVGRDAGRRERASPTTSTSSSAPTPSRSSTPTSPATSPSTARPASSAARTTCSPATTRGCSSTGWSTCVSNNAAKGGSVQLTLDPDGPERGVRRACRRSGRDVQGAVVALEPRTGKILAMVSLPTFDPNKLASHDFAAVSDRLRPAATPTRASRCSTAAIQTDAAAGLDVQARHRGGGARERQLRPPTREVPGGATYQLPQTTGRPARSTTRAATAAPTRSRSPRRWRAPATPPSPSSAVELGDDALRDQAEKFGFNEHYLDDLAPAGDRRSSPTTPTSRRPAQSGDRPVRRAGHAAADGDGRGRDRQRRRGDEALPRRRGAVARPRRCSSKTEPEEFSQAMSARDRRRADPADGRHRRQRAPAPPAAIPGVEVAGKTGTAQSGIAERAAVRLVRLVRAGRRPRGRGRRADPERQASTAARSPAAPAAARSPRP